MRDYKAVPSLVSLLKWPSLCPPSPPGWPARPRAHPCTPAVRPGRLPPAQRLRSPLPPCRPAPAAGSPGCQSPGPCRLGWRACSRQRRCGLRRAVSRPNKAKAFSSRRMPITCWPRAAGWRECMLGCQKQLLGRHYSKDFVGACHVQSQKDTNRGLRALSAQGSHQTADPPSRESCSSWRALSM